MKKKSNKKFIFIAICMIASCIMAWNLYFRVYHHTDKVNIHLFPQSIGEWTSEDLTITDEEYAILETKNAFARKYKTASGKEIFLFIVYSESNRKVSHPPEICYIGNGISVLARSDQKIDLSENVRNLKINKLLLEQGRTRQVTYYWFKVGNSYTASYWKQQVLIAVKTLLGQPSSSALIRLSSTIQLDNEPAADRELQQFSSLIGSELVKYLP